jgi:hypothetical protein
MPKILRISTPLGACLVKGSLKGEKNSRKSQELDAASGKSVKMRLTLLGKSSHIERGPLYQRGNPSAMAFALTA